MRHVSLILLICVVALGTLHAASVPAARVPLRPSLPIPVGSSPIALVAADFNHDQHADLAVANYGSNDVSVLLGDGTGSFAPARNFGVTQVPSSLAAGDLNGDGHIDLIVAGYSGDITLLRGDGAGDFTPGRYFTTTTVTDVALADFDRNGLPDIAVAEVFSDTITIVLTSRTGGIGGAGAFSAGDGPRRIVVGDYNGDVFPDLAVVNEFSDDVTILFNDQHAGFDIRDTIPIGGEIWSIEAGDLNDDAALDLVVGANEGLWVLLGSSSGTFAAPRLFPGQIPVSDLLAADFDRDGDADLAVVDGGVASVLWGDGSGGLASPVPFYVATEGGGPTAIAAGDWNEDGILDVVVDNSFLNAIAVHLGPLGPLPDSDGDGVQDVYDNCPQASNADQSDVDYDGPGDVCDNCGALVNSDQRDLDANGVGDLCDALFASLLDHPEIIGLRSALTSLAARVALLEADGSAMGNRLASQEAALASALDELSSVRADLTALQARVKAIADLPMIERLLRKDGGAGGTKPRVP